MPSFSIVEHEPLFDSDFSLRNVPVAFQIDFFILETTPGSFDKDIVYPSPFSVHADGDVVMFKDTGKILRGELHPLVGVEDFRGAIEANSFLQSLDTEGVVHCVRELPGEYFSAI